VRGKPGISPAQLAVVTVLQFAENLTDRQAADAVRGRLDWKYCLGLALEDEGFDFSVLSEFRARVVAGSAELAVLDRLLDRCKELGLVKAGGRQRTDSTHVLGRIRVLNRLELAGETVRAALEALAAAAPDWLAREIDESWQQVYGQRIDALRLPASETGRRDLAVRYGKDGYRLLEAVRAPGAPPWLRGLPAVQALRAIWVQQYYRDISEHGKQVIQRREPGEHGLPPGHLTIQSPCDTDVRYSVKRSTRWHGYKVHITETCSDPAGDDPETGRPAVPNLITNIATTPATLPDIAMTEPVHGMLAARDLAPGEHAADSGYISAGLLLSARARGITLIGPVLADTSSQARTGGYTADQFTIDWDNQQLTCPQGETSTAWRPGRQKNADVIVAGFATATCKACPARTQCTTSRTGRMLTLRTREAHQALTAARAAQDSDQWKARYKIRAGIEGTISQATHVTGIRRARYLGLPKTRLEHNIAATAINLIRLNAWWTSTPLDRTRTTHLQRLQLAPAA
jgi:hypothetical protein